MRSSAVDRDAQRFSSARSSGFSQTCSLLSRYLKEKGGFGDLTLAFNRTADLRGNPAVTMNFLPMIEEMSQYKAVELSEAIAGVGEAFSQPDPSCAKSSPEMASMTIFYAGQVVVFNEVPADKARHILQLAAVTSAPPAESGACIPSTATDFFHSSYPLDSDLPIARKNSIARFLEKRRDRIIASAPYLASKPAAPPAYLTEEWLGLSPPSLTGEN